MTVRLYRKAWSTQPGGETTQLLDPLRRRRVPPPEEQKLRRMQRTPSDSPSTLDRVSIVLTIISVVAMIAFYIVTWVEGSQAIARDSVATSPPAGTAPGHPLSGSNTSTIPGGQAKQPLQPGVQPRASTAP